jgi:hypothetical protein
MFTCAKILKTYIVTDKHEIIYLLKIRSLHVVYLES